MQSRISINNGSHFERMFGYSRAVRVGPSVSVAGCTASSPDGPVGGSDIGAQTTECLRRIQEALKQAGASVDDVVRTRLYVTDISALDTIGRIHLEFFADVRPASTIVQVSALAHPSLLVEVEADAIIAG